MLEDTDGKVIVGSQHGWLSIYDPASGRFSNSHPAGLDNETILNMCFDHNRNIWMALYGGLGKWDRRSNSFSRFNRFMSNNGSEFALAQSVAVDKEDNVWVGTLGNGLQKFDQDSGKFTRIYVPDERSPESISSLVIYCMVNINDSILALGTLDGGIDLFNRLTGKFVYITTADGLPSNTVSALFFHLPADLWAATDQGLCKVDLRTRRVSTYTWKEGILSSSFGDLLKFCALRDGSLLAGYTGGFVHFHPDSIRAREPPKNVSITGITVFDHPLQLDSILGRGDTAEFSYEQNFISIQYSSLSYSDQVHTRYFYQLVGIDKDWVRAGDRRVAYYTNLPNGNYLFRVRCENGDGIGSPGITRLLIVIHPPWWATWWFYFLCAVALAAAGYFFYFLKLKEWKMKTDLRNSVARDLHDDLGSTLSGINIFSRLALEKIRDDGGESESLMTLVSERAEKMMETLSDVVWSLNSRSDRLEAVVAKMNEFAAEMLGRCQIDCSWQVQKEALSIRLDADCTKELYLIFKEAVNNAAKYSRAGRVTVRLSVMQGALLLVVADDGQGFRPGEKKAGNGLDNMRTRAKKIGADLQIDTRPAKGTTVTVKVRLPR
jgi:two-component sensor histidine kinase